MLADKIDVLPATGGAVEDLQRPDQEEIDDVLVNRDSGEITAFAEIPTPSLNALYRPTPALYRNELPFYRFFIDGSIQTYYIGTGIEGKRSFPIELAQIGAAVVRRDDKGRVKPFGVETRILLLVPRGQFGVSDTVWAELQKYNTDDGFFEVIDTTERNINTPQDPSVENLRTRAGGIARNRMHKLEIDMISSVDNVKNRDNWLILDGAVKLDYFIKTPWMIGVAKSFRKDPQFNFGRRQHQRLDITSLLAKLPYAHRTVAFSTHDGQIAFWYVRLRKQGEVDYPLMGVVKVEYPLPERQPLTAEQADFISRTLVAERNVTPYGRDSRWHCHLYPIFLAEETIKNRFFSKQTLLGYIKWPQPNLS